MKRKLNIFGIQLILRISLVCLLSLGLGFSVVNKPFFFIPVLLVLGLGLSVLTLYWFLKKTNENLYTFLLNLKHQDFQASFPKTNSNGHFLGVNEAYNDILKQFEKKQDQYKHQVSVIKKVLDQIQEGIVVYKQNGDIEFMNTHFKKAFHLGEITHVNALYKQLPFPCFKQLNTKERKWILEPKDYHYIFTEIWHVDVKFTTVYNTPYKLCFFSQEPFNQQQNSKGWLSFVKVISHEIGNGITPIRSIAETISQDDSLQQNPSSRVNKGLGMIIKQTDDLIAFSERYRQLVQLPELQLRLMPFSEIFNHLKSTFQSVFTNKGIQFTVTGDLNKQAHLDEQLLKQAFSNLIINSIWAVKSVENPQIHITLSYRKSDWLITFEDNGCGIPSDKKYQVFIPFYTSKSEGSGIGLSLTQQIVWKHGGRIFVESELNQYTRFIITLAH